MNLTSTIQVSSYPILRAIYNLTLHPLRDFPGPILALCSPVPHFYWIYSGTFHSKILNLHNKYGSVVRVSPSILLYNSPQAWKDICGHRKLGDLSFEKDREWYPIGPSGVSIVNAMETEHSRMRRLLSHAFSEQAMREQEPLLQSYIDLLIRRLHEHSTRTADPVDMTQWFNYTTFDIIGDLSFGESFDCLKTSKYHPWVEFTFRSFKASALMRPFLALLPPWLFELLLPQKLQRMIEDNFYICKEKVARRLKLQTSRPDFISYILKHNDNDKRRMSRDEIEVNMALIMVAGSETIATLLSGCTFLLLQHPEAYRRLTTEIRTSFSSYEDINFVSAANLPYLSAVLEECLRMYPPVPSVLPRKVPSGGAIIDGRFVPGGTTVSMAYLSAFRSKANFAEPDSFLPERWLDKGSPRFAADKREVLQPFSYGPRNCLGKNLAYAEMRLIAAKLWWSFDITAAEDIDGWMDQQRSYAIWEKYPLMVKMTVVQR
ncbi:cytochrome P450 [Aspergillus caelatus]|uniref:Cytochrome P450 n=1 Tax=Aspergillus caelatus TaxID=61420 RepID=A0A5N7A5D4_9EURO|nr:cytochrome P450 [Aspergillus caelatus]KAE8364638.1 cytochrome P450 [Aspergillus caelatus]